ncbi:FadR/GntR family transcriptional regulator [Fodinicola acaciae]|uniref:FadR/GntR family transcriptional regulator n=1 Tax=Fodinicola acaciae TaxID=2681555 RepID=UPI001FEB5B14|nr:FCD domain-containing protein [Fodinicola acaciae]
MDAASPRVEVAALRNPPTRAEMAADRIAALAAERPPGARLGTKEDLRVHCGVSVGTLNEALRLLQARGLVTVRPGPGGGLFAAEQSPMVRLGNSVLALDTGQASVAEAVRIRDALEPLLVEDAMWHASPADIAAMKAKVADMAAAAQALDATAFLHANWSLHARIAAVSPHPILRSLYTSLLDLIESHTLGALPATGDPEYLAGRLVLHADLVEAIAARDSAAAVRLVAQHNPAPAS